MGNTTSSIVRLNWGRPRLLESIPGPPRHFPAFVSSPIEELHREFLKSVCIILLHHGLFWQKRRKEAPVHFRKPEILAELIDAELKETGTTQVSLLLLIRKLLYFSPAFAHPYYMFQLLAGADPYSMIGDIVVSVISSQMVDYLDSPVYISMEVEISKKLRELAGYPDCTGDCIFLPGGTLAIAYGFVLARHHRYPEVKWKGSMHLPRMMIFMSQDGHGSIKKCSIYTGFGLDNIVTVGSDDKGKMNVAHLILCIDEVLEQGNIPLMVAATSGTNALGAFDPLEEISEVCKKYSMWLHCDGCFGGGIIFSHTQRKLRLKGIELCDSFCGDMHKIGSTTQTCSFFMTPHCNILKDAFDTSSPRSEDFSSFDDSEENFFLPEMNSDRKYLEDVRRPDVVKFFIMWQGKGLSGLEANVDDAYERTKFFVDEIHRRMKQTENFVPLLEEFESPMVSFYYIPKYLRNVDRSSPEFKEKLNIHTLYLMADLINKGIMVITVQSLRQSPLFFKVILHNSCVTNRDIIYLLDQIDNFGTYLKVPQGLPKSA